MKSACIVFGADELDELDVGHPALSTLNAQGPVETNPLHSALGYVPPEEFRQAASGFEIRRVRGDKELAAALRM